MKQTIKTRIEQIGRGEVPEGYKKTKVGLIPKAWIVGTMKDILFHKVRAVPKPTTPYWRMGVRSWAKGTFRVLVENPEEVNMEELYLVEENDLVLNITFAWEHAIALATKEDAGLLVSHRFPTYVFEKGNIPQFYKSVVSLERFRRLLDLISPGGAGRNRVLDKKEFLKLPCCIPPIEEQEKIAEILGAQDKLITLQEKKIVEIQEFKKICLRKIFPAKDERVPEWRFPEFTEPWEQRKLGETVQIVMGQSPDGATYSDKPSKYILVQGNADLENGWVKPRVWTTQKTKIGEAGDLIMSVRAPAGSMGKTAYNVVLGRGVAAIKGNEFIYQLLVKKYLDGYWKRLSAGSTFESLNSETIFNADICEPKKSEQEKIGAYFETIDKLITLHQRKLEEMKKYKKALMQLLLTGIVRTVDL